MRANWNRVSRIRPCPVCGRPDWCLIAADCSAAICSRITSNQAVGDKGAGWLHRLSYDQQLQPQNTFRKPRAKVKRDWSILVAKYHAAMTSEGWRCLAKELGLSVATLKAMNVGWDGSRSRYTFPMLNDAGTVVGIRTRERGGKRSVTGSDGNGVFFVPKMLNSKHLLICEGPTDVAALIDSGFGSSIGVSPQPGLIHDQMQDSTLLRRGFFARFLLAIPISKLGSRDLTPRPIPTAVSLAYDSQILRLLSVEANEKGGRLVPHVVKLAPEAYRIWKQFQRELESMMGPDARMSDEVLTMWTGKQAGNTARVAALLQIGSQTSMATDEVISADSMERAIAFAKPLVEHSIAFHDMADHCPELSNARTVLKWLRRNATGDEIGSRTIQQSLKGRQAFKRSAALHDAIDVLIDRGWLMLKKPNPKTYYVHPAIRPQSSQNQSIGEDGEVLARTEYPVSDLIEGEL